ncbi:MAG TPA: ParB/RepB/Spo0J family partition protein [Hymenobacter sp.]|jgi:ParB/RepB/Spo0J family partition protein|uniref:ParB/RepB/Spo0J family partition protein n=1 Tax=Hymenobacter sp. TaxID=1898978 RepID=UPI002ED83EF7
MQTTLAPPSTPQLGVSLETIPLYAIRTKDNYRQDMDPVEIANLAQNIQHVGLIQPVTVRPLPVDQREGLLEYDLVAGFQRFAAHEEAQMLSILATVREMSDQEAFEARIVENMMRKDPHPADEARAIAKLMEGGMDSAEVAARFAKPLRWVAQRRALTELAPEWWALLRQDGMTLSAAEELARWPQDVQVRLLAKRGTYRIELGHVQHWVDRETRLLSSAPWSPADPLLVPAAGACVTCPKRSSCVSQLFDTEDGKDQCLDSACWATKLTARIEQQLAANSTDEQPAYRITQSYSPNGTALGTSKYELTKAKKSGFPAVYIDGPQAGHVVRIKLVGVKAVAGTAVVVPEQSRGELIVENRRKRLMRKYTNKVLAGRVTDLVSTDPEVMNALLRFMIKEQLLRGRIHVEDLLLVALVGEWNWQPLPDKATSAQEREWLEAQIAASAPTHAELLRLLVYVTVRHEIGSEYRLYQQTVASALHAPALFEGLSEAAAAEIAKGHDPKTLLRKK